MNLKHSVIVSYCIFENFSSVTQKFAKQENAFSW